MPASFVQFWEDSATNGAPSVTVSGATPGNTLVAIVATNGSGNTQIGAPSTWRLDWSYYPEATLDDLFNTASAGCVLTRTATGTADDNLAMTGTWSGRIKAVVLEFTGLGNVPNLVTSVEFDDTQDSTSYSNTIDVEAGQTYLNVVSTDHEWDTYTITETTPGTELFNTKSGDGGQDTVAYSAMVITQHNPASAGQETNGWTIGAAEGEISFMFALADADLVDGDGPYSGGYIEVEIQSSQIPSDLTDFPVFIALSELPTTGFWDTVSADGGDIRVTKDDGTELPREVAWIDTTTDTGELWFKYDGTLSSSANTKVRIYVDGARAEYAAWANFGRNAVWVDYEFVTHAIPQPTITDPPVESTGRYLMEYAGSTTPSVITGALDGGDAYQRLDSDAFYRTDINTKRMTVQYPFTMQVIAQPNLTSGRDVRNLAVGDASSTATTGQAHIGIGTSTTQHDYLDNEFDDSTARLSTEWYWVTSVERPGLSDREVYVDGASVLTSTALITENADNIDRIAIGASADSTPYALNNAGRVEEARIRFSELSSDWLTAEHNNQSSPGTFYTATASGGDSVAPVLSNGVIPALSGEITDTTADFELDTDEGNGTLYWVVTQSASVPSVAQVQAGEDHTGAAADASGSDTVTTSGTLGYEATGLTASTTYYVYAQHQDSSANESTVLYVGTFDTLAPLVDLPLDILKNNTGTVLANETSVTCYIYSTVDGSLVDTRTGQSTDGNGDLNLQSRELTAATEYRVVIVLSNGDEGMGKGTTA